MVKFAGKIGYIFLTNKNGITTENAVEHFYYGDVRKNTRRIQSSETLNDDITISNEISIIADPFARNNFHFMKYVEFMGAKWKVTNVTVEYPRLILTIGGVYNG